MAHTSFSKDAQVGFPGFPWWQAAVVHRFVMCILVLDGCWFFVLWLTHSCNVNCKQIFASNLFVGTIQQTQIFSNQFWDNYRSASNLPAMIFTILILNDSMFWALQAALSFLVRLADYADRLVIFSCCGAAIALALGAVRLGAVPLLGAALGSWGARKARRKAQGWKGWGDDGRDRVSVPIERGLAKLQWNCFGDFFGVTIWVLWMSRLSERAAVASCTSQAKAMGMKFSTSVITVSSDRHSSTNQWNWSMARFAASRSYCACFRAL